jgi:lipoyl(octanoyl) transferase
MSLDVPLHLLIFLNLLLKRGFPMAYPPAPVCWLVNRGLIPFAQAWADQRSLVAPRLTDNQLRDVLLLLEHPPVYTLGTGSSLNFLKFDPQNSPWEVHRIERGGEVTYHCPGQIVSYPILNLRRYRQDLHWYLRQLEEVVICLLQGYGLPGERIVGLTGVWVEGYKIAAIGIKVSRWITMHGFSINICPDLVGFERIIPCGIVNKPVGSLHQFLPHISLDRVRIDLASAFSEIFAVQLQEIAWEHLA